jgi:hypothetical protein
MFLRLHEIQAEDSRRKHRVIASPDRFATHWSYGSPGIGSIIHLATEQIAPALGELRTRQARQQV